MNNYKKFFKNKKITIMGLGLLGRGLGYAKFLAECETDLIVTDLKSSTALRPSLNKLRTYKNIKFVLGGHRLEDFRGKDMVIKNPGVPSDSIYVKEAKKNNIPVEMDVSLFAKCAPGVTIIGITGTRGKSMTTALVYEILSKNFKNKKVYLGGNVRGVATLPLLKKVKAGDIVVCELDSWQLQGFGEAKMSPHISVFTSFMPDHMNYYKNNIKKYFNDKANIFKYQKRGDVLIIRPGVKKLIPKNIKSRLFMADGEKMKKYDFSVPGGFQRENLACAVLIAQYFKISDAQIKKTVKNFKGLEGRLQYVKTVKGVKIYNDNNATTPEATVAGIEALSFPYVRHRGSSPMSDIGEKNIILICGGSDKGLDLRNFEKAAESCRAVILIPGTGTDRIKIKEAKKAKTLKESVKEAMKIAKTGDIILFSPAFASFGMFNNEYERNDKFMKIVKGLK